MLYSLYEMPLVNSVVQAPELYWTTFGPSAHPNPFSPSQLPPGAGHPRAIGLPTHSNECECQRTRN